MTRQDGSRLKILFWTSLVLNAFLASALVVSLFLAYRTLGVWPAWSNISSSGYGGLTDDERQGLRDALRRASPTIGPLIREARLARLEVRGLLTEPALDTQATEGAIERARRAESRLRVEVDRIMIRYAFTLPPERRILIGDALRPGRRMFDRKGPPPPPAP